jgi:cytochrome c oxidase subunit 2
MVVRCVAAAMLAGAAGYRAAGWAGEAPQTIELGARKFEFSATEIRARTGRPIRIALRSHDFVHGFSMPELGVRADVPPGRVVELELTPLKAGRFVYLCDNFCGDAHDAMTGVLVVTD